MQFAGEEDLSVGERVKMRVRDLSKVFFTGKEDFKAVENISLDVLENEFLVILGPGQAGKTLFINMLSGLLSPTTGTVELDGEQVTGTSLKISVVFQKTAIMPWKTTIQNVEMGLKYQGINSNERKKISQQFIDLVGLQGFENSYPRQLSGGMKQRVGIARAYAANPEVLLMDEPFGSLDAQTRYAMQDEILKIWETNKRTVIFITNNIEEAVYLGDRVILFSQRPARVKAEYRLRDLGRPRNYVDRAFLEMRQMIEKETDLALE